MTEPVPARIHVLLATEAPAGLVIRRGPAKQVCTLLWDRTTHTFHLGQWLKGRIDAEISDITPDGRYWGYFASQGRTRSQILEPWTAVARVPYRKALTLIPGGWATPGCIFRVAPGVTHPCK